MPSIFYIFKFQIDEAGGTFLIASQFLRHFSFP